MRPKTIILITFIIMMPLGYAYAWDNSDNSDKLSNSQSSVFSPGYINAAKQQAYATINQNDKSKSWWDNLVDKIRNNGSDTIKRAAHTKVTPELKKKTSIKQATITTATTENIITTVDTVMSNPVEKTSTVVQSQYGSIDMGDGSSRVIDKILCHFVGFGNNSFGTINNAMATANTGDRIIINGGTYSEDVFIKDGVSLFGITQSGSPVINGKVSIFNATSPIEVNGFEITGGIDVQGSSGLTIQNNRIYGLNDYIPAIFCNNTDAFISNNYITNLGTNFDPFHSPGIWGINSSLFIQNNKISGDGRGVWIEGGSAYIANNFFWDIGFEAIHTGAYDSLGGSILVTNNTFYGLSPGGTKAIAGSASTSDNIYITGSVFSPWDSRYQEWSLMGIPQGDTGIVICAEESQINPYVGIYESYEPYGYHSQGPEIADYFISDITTISYEDVITTSYISTPYTSYYTQQIYSDPAPETYADALTPGITTENANIYTENKSLSGIFRGLLSNRDALAASNISSGEMGGQIIARIVEGSMSKYAVAVPFSSDTVSKEMDVALALANILKNPTEDQKLILDAVESLLNDMKNIQEKAGTNPELTKAESDLLQMVASVLLAQGVPDLLKAGDIEGIRGIFKDLGQSKDKIMMSYNQSIKPYYDNIVRELTANLAMLQLKGILSDKITEEELKKLEPREINKILEHIRRANDKSFEFEYMLQQDAKYRKEYLDPQNRALEENMKKMLSSFTQRISGAFEDKK